MQLPELEIIYRTAPIGLAVLDRELRFVRINDRLAAMNGLPVEAHIGRSVAELLPDIAEQACELLGRVLRDGEALHDVEIRGATPSAPGVERVWVEQFTPVRDDDGRVVGISVVAEEVTEQRAAQARIAEQQQLLAFAMEAGELIAWDWDIAADRIGASGLWHQVLGLLKGPTELTYAQWAGRVHPDDLPGAEAALRDHLDGKTEAYEGEYRVFIVDEWRWVESRGKVLRRAADGRALQMVGVRRDVTRQRAVLAALERQRQELLDSRQRLEVALEAANMGAWEWPVGAAEAYWNSQMFALHGLPPRDDGRVDPETGIRPIHADDRPRVDAAIARALSEHGTYEAEYRVALPDGTWRWLLSRGRVVHTEAGQSRLHGITIDVSRSKQIEHGLMEADTRRTEFLATLAHELRNPLSPIANAVRLLERAGHDAAHRDAATRILRRQTTHMARLVDDLLEVSRITQGRIELRMENMLLAPALLQAVESVRQQALELGQRLEVAVPPELELVADPARITQVFTNLLGNAVKYTQQGGTIQVTAAEIAGEHIEVRVEDNGAGISPELLPQVFEMFSQDRRTIDRSQGGLGIGLALVRKLVALHGGTVRAESEGPGRGARFVVCLPRRGRRESLRSATAAPGCAAIAPQSILVVDDNEDAATSLARLLRMDGHRVELAFDGEQALARARDCLPRVVLLDLGMPKRDGLSVARELRAHPPHGDRLILIAMSGYAQPHDRAATEAAGFDEHLAKPVAIEHLLCAIERELQREPGAPADASQRAAGGSR